MHLSVSVDVVQLTRFGIVGRAVSTAYLKSVQEMRLWVYVGSEGTALALSPLQCSFCWKCQSTAVMRSRRSSSPNDHQSPLAESLRELMVWPLWVFTRLIGYPSPPAGSVVDGSTDPLPSKRRRRAAMQQREDEESRRQQRFFTLSMHWLRKCFSRLTTLASTHPNGALKLCMAV